MALLVSTLLDEAELSPEELARIRAMGGGRGGAPAPGGDPVIREAGLGAHPVALAFVAGDPARVGLMMRYARSRADDR